MILSKDINPKRSVYYLGAQIVGLLAEQEGQECEFLELYSLVKNTNNLSINLFYLTITWLFLLGAVSHSDKGNIVKCF